MRFVPRQIAETARLAAHNFPALVLTGPRRCGKTTLLRRLFPSARYVLLEDPDVLAQIRSDPRSFLEQMKPPVLLDEIQNAPALFPYIRTLIDAHPKRMGQWLFTGSQEFGLMKGVTESMTGRAAILDLLPLSRRETSKVDLLTGGFPEALTSLKTREMWFRSYIRTYLERDVRSVTNIRDLAVFRQFMSLLAARHGQMLNKTDLAAPLGVAVTTIGEWMSILEATAQIALVRPYFENFGKRLVKSPKVYFVDSGLACHLLGIGSNAELEKSPFLGAIFEGFVASEILKSQVNAGQRGELYYFRDHQGLEVDFLVPRRGGRLWMVECKASRTIRPSMADSMVFLRRAVKRDVQKMVLVHRAARSATAIAPGVQALDLDAFLQVL